MPAFYLNLISPFRVSSKETKIYLCFFPFTDRKNTWIIPVFQKCSNYAIFNPIYWRIIFTYFGIIRFLITFPKKSFRISGISNSVLTTSPFWVKFVLSLVRSYRKMMVWLFSKKVYYPWSFFRLSFHNTSFWIFVAEIHNNFFVLHIWLYFIHFCFLAICYEVWI